MSRGGNEGKFFLRRGSGFPRDEWGEKTCRMRCPGRRAIRRGGNRDMVKQGGGGPVELLRGKGA